MKSFAPQTVGDAGALLTAYGYALDAISSARFAQRLFRASAPSPDVAVAWAAQGAVYHELAGTLVRATKETLTAGQGLGGTPSGANADQSAMAALFRHAAIANLGAFRSSVLPVLAKAQRASLVVAEQGVAAADSEFALARTGEEVLRALPSYFANSATTDLAEARWRDRVCTRAPPPCCRDTRRSVRSTRAHSRSRASPTATRSTPRFRSHRPGWPRASGRCTAGARTHSCPRPTSNTYS